MLPLWDMSVEFIQLMDENTHTWGIVSVAHMMVSGLIWNAFPGLLFLIHKGQGLP